MPLFSKDENNLWKPDESANGPFHGLQGGGIAALMCSEMNDLAADHKLGQLTSASIQFLKPTPNSSFATDPTILRQGRRASVLVNKIVSGETTTAISTANYIQSTEIKNIESPGQQDLKPERFEKVGNIPSPHGRPWMMDAFEISPGEEGIIWFKQITPLLGDKSALVTSLITADWTHGLNRPKSPVLADPNVNLNVVFLRHPQGDHVGIRATTQWMNTGIGIGSGQIFDRTGAIGHVSMSVALTPT